MYKEDEMFREEDCRVEIKRTSKFSFAMVNSKVLRYDIPIVAKGLFAVLCSYTGEPRTCFPKIETLCKVCGLSETTLRKNLKILVTEGIISTVERYGKLGQRISNLYVINDDWCPPQKEGDNNTDGEKDFDLLGESVQATEEPETKALHSANLSAKDTVPYNAIVKLYHNILPNAPKIVDLSDKRKTAIRARWYNSLESQSLEWWKNFFEVVAQSDFLTGKVSSQNKRPFVASLDWLTNRTNCAKVLGGNYKNRSAKAICQEAAEMGFDECQASWMSNTDTGTEESAISARRLQNGRFFW